MGRKQGNSLDLNKNEILNPRFQNLSSAPSAPALGQFYFDTALDRLAFKGASAWINPADRATHTGTQTSSTISDLASVIRAVRLDEMAAPTGPVSVNGQRVTNGASPTQASDLVTRNYVDNLLNGLDWKASVRAASVANVALTGLQTIDGVSLIAGDRVLLKNQTTASENGIWVVAAGAWARGADAGVGQLTSGASVMVTEGTINGDQQWRLLTDDPIAVGTTDQSWTQIGATISYTGTNGVTVVGNVISLDTAVAVRKFSATIGDNATTTIVVTHNLNTLDVTVGIYLIADGSEIDTDVLHTSVNTVTLVFATAPTLNSYRVVIHG